MANLLILQKNKKSRERQKMQRRVKKMKQSNNKKRKHKSLSFCRKIISIVLWAALLQHQLWKISQPKPNNNWKKTRRKSCMWSWYAAHWCCAITKFENLLNSSQSWKWSCLIIQICNGLIYLTTILKDWSMISVHILTYEHYIYIATIFMIWTILSFSVLNKT